MLDKSRNVWYSIDRKKEKGSKKMFKIIFTDCYGYKVTQRFFNFEDAANYWQKWADFPIYVNGLLTDMETNEAIWAF